MFPRVATTFITCNDHLDASGARGTEIEQIFVGYLLTIIHSEFEQAIVGAVKARCDVAADERLTAFMQWAADRLVRKIAISDLTGVLSRFHDQCHDNFANLIINTVHHLAYDSIVSNRQLVAHAAGTNMTIAELEVAYGDSLAVLIGFAISLHSQ